MNKISYLPPRGLCRRRFRSATPLRLPPHAILWVDSLVTSIGGFRVLDGLSLQVDEGELRCIIGPNGAGKTSLLDAITGRIRPDSGNILFGESLNIVHFKEHEIARAGIGRKFQTPTVFERHTVFENLELALQANRSAFASITSRLTPLQRMHIENTLEVIRLKRLRDSLAGSLSHGQKQWLEIGMLLVQNPRLLLLDEPVAGMTEREVDETSELLTSLAPAHSLLVIEHDMTFVRSIARKVTVLHQGKVLAEGDMNSIQNNPRVIEVYLGGKPDERFGKQCPAF